jgi:hypothetical protein
VAASILSKPDASWAEHEYSKHTTTVAAIVERIISPPVRYEKMCNPMGKHEAAERLRLAKEKLAVEKRLQHCTESPQ